MTIMFFYLKKVLMCFTALAPGKKIRLNCGNGSEVLDSGANLVTTSSPMTSSLYLFGKYSSGHGKVLQFES